MSDKEQSEKDGKAAGVLSRVDALDFLFGEGEKQISLEVVRERIKESLDADEVKAAKITEVMYSERGREIMKEYFVYSKPLVAHSIRMQAWKEVLSLMDAYPAKTVKHEGEIDHIHKDELSPALQDAFKKIVERHE